jgi:hypothetical protein
MPDFAAAGFAVPDVGYAIREAVLAASAIEADPMIGPLEGRWPVLPMGFRAPAFDRRRIPSVHDGDGSRGRNGAAAFHADVGVVTHI